MSRLPQRERIRLLGLRHGPHYTLASVGPPTPARKPAAVMAGAIPKVGK
jgi:hypothetical protein